MIYKVRRNIEPSFNAQTSDWIKNCQIGATRLSKLYWPNISAAPFYYICIEKTIIEKTLLGNGELLGIINVRKWRHYLGLDIVSEFHLYFFWAQYMQYFLGILILLLKRYFCMQLLIYLRSMPSKKKMLYIILFL